MADTDTDAHGPHAGPDDHHAGHDHAGHDNAGHDHAGHGHAGHAHGLASLRGRQRRVLWWSLVAVGAVFVAELVGGIAFSSLALLADAAHMLTDVVGLGIALAAQRLAERPATSRHSYGLQRAEVLGAQANGVLLLAASVAVAVEAVRRLGDPADVEGGGLLAIALVGLAVNVAGALALRRVAAGSLNVRAAFLHMASDALGSVAAVTAGVAVVLWGANWVDPAVSLLVVVLVAWSALRLLRDTAHVLLEGTPRGMRADEVREALAAVPGVEAVHHLHVWNLASDVPALSAHVVLDGLWTLHEAQAQSDRLKEMLAERFGISHATLELECHPCAPDEAAHP